MTRQYDQKLFYSNLGNLKELYSIDLSLTNITNAKLKYLRNVPIINLSHTKITDKGLIHLKKVHKLIIMNTEITDQGLKIFGDDVRIYRDLLFLFRNI